MFGRVDLELKNIESRLLALEDSVISNYSPELDQEELLCYKQRHVQWLHLEEIMGCQKSWIKWLMEGDSNVAFFHASMRVKKKNKFFERVSLTNGQILDSAANVHSGAMQFFQELLTASPVEWDDAALSLLEPVVFEQENERLCRAPPMEEVNATLWSILQNSTSRPDGYSTIFLFLIGTLLRMISLSWRVNSLRDCSCLIFFGATNIVLISKVDVLNSFTLFRPISLYSVTYKILAKILLARLVPIIEEIISPE